MSLLELCVQVHEYWIILIDQLLREAIGQLQIVDDACVWCSYMHVTSGRCIRAWEGGLTTT